MAKKKIDKRKFIEGILNLQVFSDMLTQVRAEYNNISKEFDIECARYEEASKLIQTYEQQYIKHRASVLDRKNKIQARLEENNREVTRISEQIENLSNHDSTEIISSIKSTKLKLTRCENKLQSQRDEQTRITAEIMFKTDNLNKLNNNSDECPTCLRHLTGDDKKNIQTERELLSTEISKLTKVKNDLHIDDMITLRKLLDEKIVKLQEKKIDSNTIQSKITDLKDQHTRIKAWGDQLNRDIASDDTTSEELSSNTKAAVKRLDEIQQQIDSLKQELNRLDIIKFIVSEEGVKSYIVKKILQVLNNKLAYYLKKMDSNCICVFNEYFEEQIFDERGKICSYFNFSGAERKNVDLACLFAFMDIRRLQGDVVYNFSVYDELLDSSLDEKGIDLVIHILKERVQRYNEMVYIISHRKESITFVGESIGDIITLKKHKGVTTRVASEKM